MSVGFIGLVVPSQNALISDIVSSLVITCADCFITCRGKRENCEKIEKAISCHVLEVKDRGVT